MIAARERMDYSAILLIQDVNRRRQLPMRQLQTALVLKSQGEYLN
jgi:hypothetical protein